MYRTVTLWQGAPGTREEDETACKSLNRDPGVSWGRGAVQEKWVLSHISDKGALEILVQEQAFALGLMPVCSKQGLCSD